MSDLFDGNSARKKKPAESYSAKDIDVL